ncbi:EAL domain-containing protein [Pseudomonas sp. CrR25]|nr:EAL domain-containing protein [Pseudomonas sp. CrR25]
MAISSRLRQRNKPDSLEASQYQREGASLLAHNLGLKVVAEGIETREQLGFLRDSGCDRGQGYYFCRPLSADTFFQHALHRLSMADLPACFTRVQGTHRRASSSTRAPRIWSADQAARRAGCMVKQGRIRAA